MKYVLLIHQNAAYDARTPEAEREAIMKSHRELQSRGCGDGSYLGAVRLAPTDTAVSIRKRGKDTIVVDGPYAETKEQLVGFYIFDKAEASEAVDSAKAIRMFPAGAVEVRPVAWAPAGFALDSTLSEAGRT